MKSNFTGINEVGHFNIVSGSVEVTDPCYQPGDGVVVENVKNGEYVVFTHIVDKGQWGRRNAQLYALNQQYMLDNEISEFALEQLDWEPQAEYFNVDSGQGGIFDTGHYPGGDNAKFYGRCGNITLKGLGAGSLEFGAVSSSGFGDGGYDFELLYDNTVVVGIKLIFINDADDNEEEDEE